ncbi:hypothetical protein [Fibrella forsythiae]|uniref:Uncharacterized protein n=1 Tax=Fibrella forsythiae TaxID=2817061 RepID=A0ABS3JT58_9BACT|nr:hypothetical protein [Fibrella forsythiae]MBO0953185.1 hypothetical protein [Fibrella forsythiae]
MTQTEVIRAFEALPLGERLIVARTIQLKMADQLFEELDGALPDAELSTQDIQKEIKAYRHAQKKKNQLGH